MGELQSAREEARMSLPSMAGGVTEVSQQDDEEQQASRPLLEAVTLTERPINLEPCPHCGEVFSTTTESRVGFCTHLAAAGCCLMLCVCGCCLIPYGVAGCKDVVHVCP